MYNKKSKRSRLHIFKW